MAGGIDPVTAMLSDYALRPGWWMWDLALTVTSAGSAAVLLALHRQGVLRGRIAVSGMGVWWVSVLLVAAITKDPQGGAVTITGKLHLYATAASCVSLPIAGWALGRAPRTSAMAAAHPGSARTVEPSHLSRRSSPTQGNCRHDDGPLAYEQDSVSQRSYSCRPHGLGALDIRAWCATAARD
jgi:hypothetical protein